MLSSLVSKPKTSIRNIPYKSKTIYVKPVYKNFFHKQPFYNNTSILTKHNITTKAIPDWMDSIELIGHGIVYFTLFYCSMNWIYYRNTRIDTEKIIEDKKSKKDKINGKKDEKDI